MCSISRFYLRSRSGTSFSPTRATKTLAVTCRPRTHDSRKPPSPKRATKTLRARSRQHTTPESFLLARASHRRRFAHAVLSVFYMGLSPGLARNSRRASSLASHCIVKAAEVPAVSQHPSWCVRRGWGGTFSSTASKISSVKDSNMSEILLGFKGRSGSLEIIRATKRCLRSPPDLNL